MLYNRFTEHVVNDRKKMYKRGSQWVVASAFVLLFGGAALNFPAQTVDAATLTVSPVTLTKQPNGTVTASSTQSSSAASAQTAQVAQPTSNNQEEATTAKPDAVTTTQTGSAKQAAAANQTTQVADSGARASAAYQAASLAANANTSMPAAAPSSMTEEQWQAQKAKYEQAKSAAAQSEAAAKAQAEAAKSSYADQMTQQAEAQKNKDVSAFEQLKASGSASMAAMQSSQASSYTAASQAADETIAELNSQRTSTTVQVGDGGTFDYVAKHGAWNNISTRTDRNSKNWNGNYLVQNLPVLSDKQVNDYGNLDDDSVDKYYDNSKLYTINDDENTPQWALTDLVKNQKLSTAQQYEVNQYAMMLTNNYREALGLSPLVSTADFLTLVQQRGNSMLNDTEMHHDGGIIESIFGGHGGWSECLASNDPNWLMGDRKGDPTMIDVLQSVAESINDLFNFDADSKQGHRRILLSESISTATGGWAYQKIASGDWVLNFNGVTEKFSGTNIATVPVQESTSTDNNYEINQKIAAVKTSIADLKAQQNIDYQSAYSAYVDAQQALYNKIAADDSALIDLPKKIRAYNAQQDAAVQDLIKTLTAQVAQLDPGPEPTKPSSGSSSSASSAGSSASSSAASSSASSAGSSASSSAASSSASSAGSSAASSAGSS
ncbi:MAG: SEC10/PgrA surface exclusion domain-containing protein, partial [Lacticaseibacillus paracasei]|nr:SEC10/PgrA surface exclusion domain-containing protein [Lacticaseibacillus paracasei]